MQKPFVRVISLLCCFIFTFISLSGTVNNDYAAASIVESGRCGEKVNYTLDSDGNLTISGTGPTWNYHYSAIDGGNPSPFDGTIGIKNAIIKNGVTAIGNELFNDCYNLSSISIPDTVKSIGRAAFSGCGDLTLVTLPEGVTEIGSGAFFRMGICALFIPRSVKHIGSVAFSLSNLTDIYYAGSQDEWRRINIENQKGIEEDMQFELISLHYSCSGKLEFPSHYSKGDVIEFGWYPQHRVTDAGLTRNLNDFAGKVSTWKSYGYNDQSKGGFGDGMVYHSDFMVYKDVYYHGATYRGVYFTKPRYSYEWAETSNPDGPGEGKLILTDFQGEYGYKVNTVYWFKFEPIKWRVLDPAHGLALCETILDGQPLSETFYRVDSNYYRSKAEAGKVFATDYTNTFVRSWLNNTFMSTAFSPKQQEIINTTYVGSSFNSGVTFSDNKAYLLDKSEAEKYSEAIFARSTSASDYAKCQGMFFPSNPWYDIDNTFKRSNYNKNDATWLLRGEGVYGAPSCWMMCQPTAASRDVWDSISGICEWKGLNLGIRPAIKFNLLQGRITQSDLHSWDGGKKTAEPTCLNNGTKTFTCTVCGVTRTEPIPKISEHAWNSGVITKYPSTEWEGVKTYTCTICGKTRTETLARIPIPDRIIPGDVDLNGKHEVSDARLCLRCAIGLEEYNRSSAEYIACEVDGTEGISVSDARLILRVAIRLDNPGDLPLQ